MMLTGPWRNAAPGLLRVIFSIWKEKIGTLSAKSNHWHIYLFLDRFFFFLMWGESILYQSRGTSIPDRFGILSLEEAKLLMLPLSKDYPFRSFIIHNDLKAIIHKMMEKMPISNSMEQTGKYHDKDTVWKQLLVKTYCTMHTQTLQLWEVSLCHLSTEQLCVYRQTSSKQ